MTRLKRYLIERDIPGIGGMSIVELCGAARASNRAIEQVGDKTFCIYLATGEDVIRKHAELSGIPITRIVEVLEIIDPLTANN